MTCPYADDAYLVKQWPGVVLRSPERWLVVVDDAAAGVYSVTMKSLPYEVLAAVPPDTQATVRDALVLALLPQVAAAVQPQGLYGVLLTEVVQPGQTPTGLGVSVVGPAPDTLSATLIDGGDANEEVRLYWLEQVKCSLPPCGPCGVTCAKDFTAMHAALAAHWLFITNPASIGATGAGANDFERMRLGPAELSKGVQQGWGTGADGELAKTVPGRLFLMLRRKYIFPVMCA